MTGYQEILTDPSYRGQIVAMTYPLIGNTGINSLDIESSHSRTSRASSCASFRPSSAVGAARSRSTRTSTRHKIPGITGIDTRSLTLRLRTQGSLRGVLTSEKISDAAAVDLAKKWNYLERDFVKEVTCAEGLRLGPEGQAQPQMDADPGQARARRASPHRRGLPREAPAGEIPDRRVRLWPQDQHPAPLAPARVPGARAARHGLGAKKRSPAIRTAFFSPTARAIRRSSPTRTRPCGRLIGKKPIFGICLGHQILGYALGGKTFKLKFGHRGGNQPVKDLTTGRIASRRKITASRLIPNRCPRPRSKRRRSISTTRPAKVCAIARSRFFPCSTIPKPRPGRTMPTTFSANSVK